MTIGITIVDLIAVSEDIIVGEGSAGTITVFTIILGDTITGNSSIGTTGLMADTMDIILLTEDMGTLITIPGDLGIEKAKLTIQEVDKAV